MKMHEMYIEGTKDGNQLESKDDRNRLLEGALQMGWFEHRCQNLSDAEIQEMAVKIAHNQESDVRKDYILSGTLDIKKEAVMTDLIDPEGSELGSAERKWFREMFPAENNATLPERFKEILLAFENDPESAYHELDVLFAESQSHH